MGVGKLYSPVNEEPQQLSVVDRLAESTVTVIGIGGIGLWSVKALCRSGVGNIIMIDLDDICISNSNCQLHALSGSIGKFKTHVMKDRLLDINPGCNVTLVETFVRKFFEIYKVLYVQWHEKKTKQTDVAQTFHPNSHLCDKIASFSCMFRTVLGDG